MIYAYIRVSTEKQTVKNQRQEIERYCQSKGLEVDKWIKETVSGTKKTENNEKEKDIGSYSCRYNS